MASAGFQKGNKLGGRRAEKMFRDALLMQIKAAGPDGKRLRTIAEALLKKAEEGDMQAINVIADRLDGKPHQDTSILVTDDRPPIELTAVELAHRTVDTLERIENLTSGTTGEGKGKDGPADVHQFN